VSVAVGLFHQDLCFCGSSFSVSCCGRARGRYVWAAYLFSGPLVIGLTFFCGAFVFYVCNGTVFSVYDKHGPHGSCIETFCPCLSHFPHRASYRLKQ
jgi:hypothetical protein